MQIKNIKIKQSILSIAIIAIIALSAVGLFVTGELLDNNINDSQQESISTESNLDIATSIYPIKFLVEELNQNTNNQVTYIIPTGVDTHDFEPSPKQAVEIIESDMLVYQGLGIDNWAKDIAAANQSLKSLEVSEGIDTIEGSDHNHSHDDEHSHEDEHKSEDHEEEEKTNHEHENKHKGEDHDDKHEDSNDEQKDPHIWLDPENMIKIAEKINKEQLKLDPENSEIYNQNYNQLKKELETINENYQQKIASCEVRKIVVSHNAFGYLGEKYDIEIADLAGLDGSQEMTIQEQAQIIQTIKDENIDHIFYEEKINPDLARQIATQTDTQLLELRSIEYLTADEEKNNQNYINLMEENLKNLTTAMKCQ